jgi:hypothetical protein
MMPLVGANLAWNPALTLGLEPESSLETQAVKKRVETARNAAILRNFIVIYSPKMPS